MKKACMFFVFCGGLFFTFASMFAVGHFLHNDAEAAICVKYACFIAVWVFGTTIQMANVLLRLRQSDAGYNSCIACSINYTYSQPFG